MDSKPGLKRLLVLVEEGGSSPCAIEQALELAPALGAELVFAHVLPVWNAPISDVPIADTVPRQAFDEAARKQGRDLLELAHAQALTRGVASRGLMVSGPDPVQVLGELATQEGCSMIVVGTESTNAVWRILGGSPVPGLISHAPVPVLVCKPRGVH